VTAMHETSFARRRGAGRVRDRHDDGAPPPGPLCLWRYLLGWCAVSVVWIAVVYVKAVILKQQAMYGTSLLYLAAAYGCVAWLAEEAYVSWKERQGTATEGDYTEPGTKKWLLLMVVVGGGCLTFGIMLGVLSLSGVWTPQRGMAPPDNPAPTAPNAP